MSTRNPGGTTNTAKPEGYVSGRPVDGSPQPQPQPQSEDPSHPMQAAAPLRPGEWHSPDEYAPPPKRDREKEEQERKRARHKETKSLADERGEEWGLRDVRRDATAITRPIRVWCYADRLVLVPETGSGEPHVIAVDARMARSIDKFVAAVWEYMDTWGIAGKRMYWRPVLNVYVAPGAEAQFQDFNALLQGSGLTIERKS
jgi:hypothetical protein